MRIIQNKKTAVRFGEVSVGQVFKYAGEVYIRIEEVESADTCIYHALDVVGGRLFGFEGDEECEVFHNASLVLE